MSPYEVFLDRLGREATKAQAEAMDWLAGLGATEQVLATCVFALTLLWLSFLRPQENRSAGHVGRQFVFALILIVLFGFGAGWLLSPGHYLDLHGVRLPDLPTWFG